MLHLPVNSGIALAHRRQSCLRPIGWRPAHVGSSSRRLGVRSWSQAEADAQATTAPEVQHTTSDAAGPSYVTAPLLRKGAGPGATYVALALRFPNAATSNQRRRGQRGVSLDFILDTGSTVNVLNPMVAQELALPVVGMQPAGSAAGGGLVAAPIFMLGDTQLDYLAPEQRFTFMTGMQAAALAVPSPSCSGILGRAFIDCFAAVELRFKSDPAEQQGAEASVSQGADNSAAVQGSGDSAEAAGPSSASGAAGNGNSSVVAGTSAAVSAELQGAAAVAAAAAPGSSDGAGASGSGIGGDGYEIRFHAEYDIATATEAGRLRSVPLSSLGETGLWGAQLRLRGPDGSPEVVMPALVDTGAPVTILNAAAAAALGLSPAAPEPPAQSPTPAPRPGGGGGLLGGIGKMLGLGGGGKGPGTPGAPGAAGGMVGGGHMLRPLQVSLDMSLSCSSHAEAAGGPGGAAPVARQAGQEAAEASAGGTGPHGTWAHLGSVRPCVGDLPGFQALGIAPGQPGAILGLDALAALDAIVFCPKEAVMLL